MISYKNHLKHMLDAASKIENPQGFLYKAIVKFRKNSKKPNFRVTWGRVYSFMYAAKNARTLPYYDRYPLVLVMSRNIKNRTFDGLNLHYVNPFFRTFLLRGIAHIYMNGPDRYQVKEFQEAVSRLAKRIAKPCMHRYRVDRVLNFRYIRVPGLIPEHLNAVKDETYIKSGLQRVWVESTKAIVRGAKWKLQRDAKKKAAAAAKRHMEVHAKAAKSSSKPKTRKGKPIKESASLKASKARTGKKYTDKSPKPKSRTKSKAKSKAKQTTKRKRR